jgi:AcrR family transcriptional regulator
MSIPYEATGRTRQKARTRDALVRAARGLLAEGVTPTVEAAADVAEVSRTTAYRYFPNQRMLLVATFPEVEAGSLLPDQAPADVPERLDAAVRALPSHILEHEHELRAQLRLSLEPDGAEPDELPFRAGRAIGWLEDALAPLRETMPPRDLRRLVLSIRSAVGIEALVWLTDVAGLPRDDAAELMRWSAGALLRAALPE